MRILILVLLLFCQAGRAQLTIVDFPEEQLQTLKSDLKKLKSFRPKKPSPLYKNVSTNIELEDISLALEPGAMAFIHDDKLYVTFYYFSASLPERLATLAHEIRHINGPSHDLFCRDTRGREILSPNSKNCDSIADGAIGTEVSFYLNWANSCTDCDEIDQFTAITKAQRMSARIIGEKAIEAIRAEFDFFDVEPMNLGRFEEVLD